ncbi:hypothetical protein AB4505_07785, partial [Vibrio splendidus]
VISSGCPATKAAPAPSNAKPFLVDDKLMSIESFLLKAPYCTFFYKHIHQISNSASLISYALSHTVILSYLVLFKVVGHNTLCT